MPEMRPAIMSAVLGRYLRGFLSGLPPNRRSTFARPRQTAPAEGPIDRVARNHDDFLIAIYLVAIRGASSRPGRPVPEEVELVSEDPQPR